MNKVTTLAVFAACIGLMGCGGGDGDTLIYHSKHYDKITRTETRLISMLSLPLQWDDRIPVTSGSIDFYMKPSGEMIMICVGNHDFPGRRAAIRVDDHAPVYSADGCFRGALARRLENQVENGTTVVTQFTHWPWDWPNDREIDIAGKYLPAKAKSVAN